MKSAKRPVAACFLHTFLLENEAQTSGKKNTGLSLSIKSETTCKNSTHLDEKKKQKSPKFDIEWLCCDIFNLG